MDLELVEAARSGDEEAFAARQAAYYVKYQNAPTRFAGTWPDPKVLHIAGLPKARR